MNGVSEKVKAKVVVLGAGPGGYSAAFRAADLLGEGVVLGASLRVVGQWILANLQVHFLLAQQLLEFCQPPRILVRRVLLRRDL